MMLDAISRGYLDGSKVGIAFAKYHHQVGVLKLISNTFGSYQLYHQAHSLGLFEKYPGLIKPIKWGLVGVAVVNLATVVFTYISIFERTPRKSEGRFQTKNPIWNLTPKINTIGTIATTLLNRKEHPERALAFCASSAVMFVLSWANLVKNVSWVSWIPRSYIFVTGDWNDRGGIAFKAVVSGIHSLMRT